MDFALTAEHEMLREAARDFLESEVDLAPLLVPGATVEQAARSALWAKMSDLGWPSLIVPETFGGLGMSHVDLAMIVGEAGRTLAPAPLFGTLAGTFAILAAGSDAQKDEFLAPVAAGACRLALALADVAGRGIGTPLEDVRAEQTAQGMCLTGIRRFAVDAASADRIVICAPWEGESRWFVVDAAAAGVTIERVEWRDITREVCTVVLDSAPAVMLDRGGEAVWPAIRDRLYLVLAAESAGGLHAVLDDTVAYAKERVAFGRPIGAFQAIKHQLAEMKGQAECASAAILYAAWALDENPARAPVAAAMAQSYASEAYCEAAHRSIQIFGAIGFTWEMRNHLFFKRARANAALLGAPAQLRSDMLAALVAHRAMLAPA